MTQQGITLWLKDEVKEGDKIKIKMIEDLDDGGLHERLSQLYR